ANGRAVLVGDAAGLVDPISGDGMYEAFVSAQLAADGVRELLGGRQDALDGYAARLDTALARDAQASWAAKLAFDRYPRPAPAFPSPPRAGASGSAATRVGAGPLGGAGAVAPPPPGALGGLGSTGAAGRSTSPPGRRSSVFRAADSNPAGGCLKPPR